MNYLRDLKRLQMSVSGISHLFIHSSAIHKFIIHPFIHLSISSSTHPLMIHSSVNPFCLLIYSTINLLIHISTCQLFHSSIRPSLYPSVDFTHPLTYQSTHPLIYLLFIVPLIHPSICLLFHSSIHPSIHPSICSFHSSISLLTHSSIHPSVYWSIPPSIYWLIHQFISLCRRFRLWG